MATEETGSGFSRDRRRTSGNHTYLNKVFSLKDISDFINDDVIFSPSKPIEMDMLNHHLHVTSAQGF